MAGVESAYTIGGVKVLFPCKAYPSQISMMDKIIKGLERGQNCLLESPTGSGKSLALLCSALAWQAAEYEKVRQAEMEEQAESACNCGAEKPAQTCAAVATGLANQSPVTAVGSANGFHGNQVITIDDDDDNDFQPTKKTRPVAPSPGLPAEHDYVKPDYEESPKIKQCCACQCREQTTVPRKKVPKIYFGTRTHKQIAQICKELSRTAYKHVRMSILSSREHSCVHPEVSRMSNKNEECKNKRDGPGCRYFDRSKMLNHTYLSEKGLDTAWDLEDFLGMCKKSKACAYFGARGLKDFAQVVFCPYNYLVDPGIRERMEISVKGQIVILDEAHNIEDSAREAASYTVSQKKLEESISDLTYMVNEGHKVPENTTLTSLCRGMEAFIAQHSGSIEGNDYNQAHKVWSGLDMIAQFQLQGLGEERLKELKKAYIEVTEDSPEERERGIDLPKLKPVTRSVIEGLIMVLGNIYKEHMKFRDDYRVAIGRTTSYEDIQTGGVWLTKRRRPRAPVFVHTVSFWCMNPAVSFCDLGEAARSIVLTSGTLSPMTSFESELGVRFSIQLEANHVISKSQVWVGAVSRGPKGGQLLGTYQTAETYGYQDEVGRLILEVCQTIPHGVLCFLPSYKSLDKLVTRWRATGLWDEIQEHKHAMTEPRASEKADFEEILGDFYQCIKDTDTAEAGQGITGALFLAVCRGKVSEGLDFTDNNARAVITVGIPFPNFKDKQVELKQRYNDGLVSKGLLKGRDWYEIQAFRALNQALGRCIRHKKDWGALILVDERFAKTPRYIRGLSKWIRNQVQYHGMFTQAKQSLREFTEGRLNPEGDLTMSATLDSTMLDVSGVQSPAVTRGLQRTSPSTPVVPTPQWTTPQRTTPLQTTPIHRPNTPTFATPHSTFNTSNVFSPMFKNPAARTHNAGTRLGGPVLGGFTPAKGGGPRLEGSIPGGTSSARTGGPTLGGPETGGPTLGVPTPGAPGSLSGGGFLSESQQAVSQVSLNQTGLVPSQFIQGVGFGEDIISIDDDILDFNPPLSSTQIPSTPQPGTQVPLITRKPLFKSGIGQPPSGSPLVTIHPRANKSHVTPQEKENIHTGMGVITGQEAVGKAEKDDNKPNNKPDNKPNNKPDNMGCQTDRLGTSVVDPEEERAESLGTRRSGRVRRASALMRESKRQKSHDDHGATLQETQTQATPGGCQVPETTPSSASGDVYVSPIVIQPKASTSPDTERAAHRCKAFLSKVRKLSASLSSEIAVVVQGHIQALVDGQESPEDFTTSLQRELSISPAKIENVGGFLKLGLPALQQGIADGSMSIEGVRAPGQDVTCPVCHTPLTSLSDCTPHTHTPDFTQAAGWSPGTRLVSVSEEEVRNLQPYTPVYSSKQEIRLNSYWSAEDECCVRMLSCGECTRDGECTQEEGPARVLGVQVLISNNSKFPAKQVWFQAT